MSPHPLNQLPVRPNPASNSVQETYIAELKAVTTPEQLSAFVLRWQSLYKMTRYRRIPKKEKDAKRYRVTQNNLKKLIVGDFDPAEALSCIQVSRDQTCRHAAQYSCVGLHIMVPTILLDAMLVAQEYVVPTDLALIQMCGGMGVLEGY